MSPGPDHTAVRRLLAFYGSTPAYRPVLDAHGWGELQPELNSLSKQGKWQEMGALISDEILFTITACGSPREIAAHIRTRAWRASGHRVPVPAGADCSRDSGRRRRRTFGRQWAGRGPVT